MTTIQRYLQDGFTGLRVLVIGEAMLDSYLKGGSDRLCREAPVPVVTLAEARYLPGGAANAAVNLRGMGANVDFLSVTGDDREADLLAQALHERQVPLDGVFRDAARRTLAKQRIICNSQVLLRFDQGSTESLDGASENRMIRRLETLWPQVDAVLVSHYGYGILTPRIINALRRQQERCPRMLAVDAKQLAAYRDVDVTLIKPNYEEVTALLGLDKAADAQERADQIIPYEEQILDMTGARIVAVTLDSDGALIFERGHPPYRTYARPCPNSRAAGAGDTYVSAFALALASGAQAHTAAEIAAAAAGVVVGKEGTSTCSIEELREYLSATGTYVTELDKLAARIDFCRKQGQRIVFTNGCFDILHRGHINYLNRAKRLGDVMIVGLNSDESIRRLKGPSRPINSLDDRAQVMAALSCIDYIIAFGEDTPVRLIEAIKPDIFVKGGDYTRATLPEAGVVEAYGGSVQILPYLQDFSTTGMIERIREVYAPPGPDAAPPPAMPAAGGIA